MNQLVTVVSYYPVKKNCSCIFVSLSSFVEMSSSKRKLAADKSTSDEKSKPSVFDRLGPSRSSEAEVNNYALILLFAFLKG